MDRRLSTVAAATCCVVLTLAFAAKASATCKPDPDRVPIRVSVDKDGQPVVTPTDVTACVGETIKWIFPGTAAKEFAVKFKSLTDSPFYWTEQKGAKLEGTVSAEALKGGKRTEYKYSVDVDGKVLDPMIIIEP